MKTYVVDNGTLYKDNLLRLVAQYNPILVDYQSLDYRELNSNDLVILSGGHNDPVLWHDDAYQQEIDIIKHHPGPIIGICLGFELICHVFGTHLHFMGERRKGLIPISQSIENDLVPNHMTVKCYENHNWSVIKLEKPLEALAHSADGIEVLRHTDRPLLGMQFHPDAEQGDGAMIFRKMLHSVVEDH